VDAGAEADLDHVDDQVGLLDRMHDAIGPLAHTLLLLFAELLRAAGTRIIRQLADASDYSLTVALLWEGLDLADRRWLDAETISCHCA